MTPGGELLAGIWFAVLVVLPGAALLSLVPSPGGALLRLLISSFGVSLAYLCVTGLVLLRFDSFTPGTLTLVASPPVAIAVFGHVSSRRRLSLRLGNREDLVYGLVLGVLVLAAVVLTPRWSFLVAPNMDAGNYEVYGNFFWRSGQLYMDVADLLQRGVPLDWIDMGNTWRFDAASATGRPAYVYGYPVLLGVTKAVFASASASWILNASVAVATAILLYLLVRDVTEDGLVSLSIALMLVATPLFFYYSKQFMGEMLALFGITLSFHALSGRAGTPDMSSALVAASGVTLALLTKIDMLPVVVFLVLAAAVAAIESHRRAVEGPGSLSVLGLGAGVVVAASMTTWLVSAEYLGPRVALGRYIGPLGRGIPGGRHLLLALAAGGAIVVCLAVAMTLRGRRPDSEVRPAIANPWGVIPVVLVLFWILFGIWNAWIRPAGVAFVQDHEAYNLVRLLPVFSPVLLVGVFVLSPAVLGLGLTRRWITIGVLAGLGFVLYESAHTPPEIWWMRRYLATLLPAAALVAAAGVAVARRVSGRPRIVTGVVVVAAIMFLPLQIRSTAPLFAHEVNVDAPQVLATILDEVPGHAPLVVLGSDKTLRGMANTLQSMREAPTLLEVPPSQLSRAAGLFPSEDFAVISGSPLPLSSTRELRLRLVEVQTFARQWSNDLDTMIADPDRAFTSPFLLYVRRGAGGEPGT